MPDCPYWLYDALPMLRYAQNICIPTCWYPLSPRISRCYWRKYICFSTI